MLSRHYRVSGLVQGVFYRATAQQVAQKIGLVGWVRNIPGGDVESQASGTVQQLAEYENWLRSGSEMARVDNIQITELAETGDSDMTSFEIKY